MASNYHWNKNCKAEKFLWSGFQNGDIKATDRAKTVYEENKKLFGGFKYNTF
jgi:hypothetical protein